MRGDDVAVIVTCILILADWLISYPFWHLESNPLAVSMGPWVVLLVKIGVVVLLLMWWFWVFTDLRRRWWMRVVPFVLLLWFSIVLGSNIAVAVALG